MGELWTTVANRLLAAIAPATVLDVANDGGAFAESACGSVAAWEGKVISVQAQAGSARPANLELRTRYSPSSLSSVEQPDLVVLHGEPNWWTTTWQLAAVATAAEAAGQPLPPIVIARAGAPWGRRDCYEAPEAIPAEARQPHRREGDRWVALEQGTPQNGVMTAVEGFARDRGGLEVILVPGLGGVAVVLDPDGGDTLRVPARALLAELRLSGEATGLLEAVDAERLEQLARAEQESGAAVERDELQVELAALRERVQELATQLASERTRAERAQAQASTLEQLRYGPSSEAAADAASAVGAGNGKLGDEPTRSLIRATLRPAELLHALGWLGGEDELALPIPVDHRGVAVPGAARSLVVIAAGDPMALRRTLCSVLERAAEPVALTVVRPSQTSAPLDQLLATLELAVPTIEVVSAVELEPRPGAQRLLSGEELPWGWPEHHQAAPAPAVAYLLPGMAPEGSGGVNSVVQEARGLRALGAQAWICIPGDALERAQHLYGNHDALFLAYADDAGIIDAVGDATVAVATEHTSVSLLARLARARPELTCAYYVQDYEPLFAELASPRSDRALLSYGAVPGTTLFAKTHFVRNVITALHGVMVAKVPPSLDGSVFNAEGRSWRRRHRLTVIAMLRPRTPRRRPHATVAAMSLIAAALGDDVELVSFGCDASELSMLAGADLRHLGRLRPRDVADELRLADVFIDGSAYQAFGRSGLEAMACGAVPVLPSLGGVGEYAIDGENSVVLQDDSPRALADAVIELAGDRPRLERLRTAGSETASRFSIDRAAQSQLDLFNSLQRLTEI